MRKKYQEGTYIPPNNIFFKTELPPKIYSNGRKVRRGVFICPYDGVEFVTDLQRIYTGHTTSCGCINRLDLTGQRFGKLVAIKRDYDKKDKNNNFYWECKCDCGNTISVAATYLKGGKSTSCLACSQTEDIKNQMFGKLTALQFMYQDKVTYIIDTGEEKTFYKLPNIIGAQWICKCECGNYLVTSYNHLVTYHTTSCGCRKASRGEQRIQELLGELQIPYIRQYTVLGKYRIDFYIPDMNIAIEYDGEQHFFPIEYFGGKESFIKNQERDNIKNLYCSENNIRLIRIPYTQLSKLTISFLSDILHKRNQDFDVRDSCND